MVTIELGKHQENLLECKSITLQRTTINVGIMSIIQNYRAFVIFHRVCLYEIKIRNHKRRRCASRRYRQVQVVGDITTLSVTFHILKFIIIMSHVR